MASKNTEDLKQKLIDDLNERVDDEIIERENANLLIELIKKTDTIDEAVSVAELGTTYKRTGFHFDKRLDHFQLGDTIRFLSKLESLSFSDGSDDIHNKLIIGDNYDALQQLLITYKGSIDVIYIDPPYAKDDMGEFADTNYNNAITRDNLLSMLYPRLMLARELLSPNGFIFCSIDDKNYAYVKCLFDEVFQEAHFINTFVWQKNSSEKTDKTQFTINTEYVLFYAKTKDYILGDTFKPLSEASLKMYKYDDNDGRGLYQTVSLQKPKNPGPETTYDYTDNNGKVWKCPPKGWRIKQSKLKDLENDGRLHFGKTLRQKDYWNERKNSGKRIDTLWNDLPQNSAGSAQLEDIVGEDLFDNPKPTDLIKRCVDISDENAIVLDFFAGSGTTGQAVLELNREDGGNRKFILCTNNEINEKNPRGIALDVTTKRLKRTMTGECYDGTNDFPWLDKNEPLGGSLDVFGIKSVANFETTKDKTPFDVIDETCYGQSFDSIEEKIKWVCENFDRTQEQLEGDK